MASEKKFTYKNITDLPQTVIGVGVVEAGKTIESDTPVHNPNLQLVNAGRMTNVEAPAEQPKPGNTTFTGREKNK